MTYYLARLFPTGLMQSGNQIIAQIDVPATAQAIEHFQVQFPQLKLNDNGYAKHGEESFVVAEQFQPITTFL